MLPRIRILQPMFNFLNPLARMMGPEINRRTDENIKKARFEMILEKNLLLTIFRLIETKKS
jgi:demethylmenaquinone methyltransferase/2-methoxy-6-polyprenyl-1,4-benzoquinol methylase